MVHSPLLPSRWNTKLLVRSTLFTNCYNSKKFLELAFIYLSQSAHYPFFLLLPSLLFYKIIQCLNLD